MQILRFNEPLDTIFHPLTGIPIVKDGNLQPKSVLAEWVESQPGDPKIHNGNLSIWWGKYQTSVKETQTQEGLDSAYELVHSLMENAGAYTFIRAMEIFAIEWGEEGSRRLTIIQM